MAARLHSYSRRKEIEAQIDLLAELHRGYRLNRNARFRKITDDSAIPLIKFDVCKGPEGVSRMLAAARDYCGLGKSDIRTKRHF